MIAYLDASVLLRVVLRQPDALHEWRIIEQGIASALVEVECLRTLDRLRIADREIAVRREAIFRLMEAMEKLTKGLDRFSTVGGLAMGAYQAAKPYDTQQPAEA